ncbi:exodeoxyribonuclease VII large subunit [Flavobacteriales bacterium]|nr:exodeoxyribonuclease VII large subunit [Flavobacteriales bacterium]
MFHVYMTSTNEISPASLSNGPERKVFPLSKVTKAVGSMLEKQTKGALFWVRAEISQRNFKGKHVYLDLVEEKEGSRLAQLRGTIWGGRLEAIRAALGKEFDEVLKPGREIVFSAHMAFHAVYGFSLNIQNIDLDALLGEMERRRKATLEALKKEGAIGRNGRLPLSSVPQRLVLIGSKGTAGFTDFLAHLDKNAWGYRMDIGIIDTSVQGLQATSGLVSALHQAGRVALKSNLDAVVVLRGGGAKLDLDAFNDLTLCRTVAAMEIPVIVGVGHETDQTLMDVVAHTACKTPTAVADFIINRMTEFEGAVGREGRAIAAESRAQLSENRGWLGQYSTLIKERPLAQVRGERGQLYSGANAVVHRTRTVLSQQIALVGQFKSLMSSVAADVPAAHKQTLEEVQERMRLEVARQLKQQEERVGSIQDTLALLGPEPTLRRGFSITRKEGKAVRRADELVAGDVIETRLAQGTIKSRVESTSPKQTDT